MIRVPFEHAFSITNIKSGFEKCTLSTLMQSQVPRCCRLHPMALLMSLAHRQSRVPHLPLHLSMERVAALGIQLQCLPSLLVPAQRSLTTRHLIRLRSLQVVCNSEGSSLSSISSPSPVVSPLNSQSTSGVSCSTPTLNPLVRVGLIPPHLADILTPPAVTRAN